MRSASRRLILGAPGISVTLALLAALTIAASPALAFTIQSETGAVGAWAVRDNAVAGEEGARCYYVNDLVNGGSKLTRIRVQPPSLVNGTHSKLTWVGWQYKILKSSDAGLSSKVIYKSKVWKDKASLTTAADAFVPATWYAPSFNGSKRFLVRLKILWYAPGSSTSVEGKVVGTYENYVEKYAGFPAVGTTPFCVTPEA